MATMLGAFSIQDLYEGRSVNHFTELHNRETSIAQENFTPVSLLAELGIRPALLTP